MKQMEKNIKKNNNKNNETISEESYWKNLISDKELQENVMLSEFVNIIKGIKTEVQKSL